VLPGGFFVRENVSRFEHSINRFWRSVEGGTLDTRRPWTGYVFSTTGYGRLEVRLSGERKVLRAHRVAWALANRTVVSEGVLVRHFCSTRTCCNPTHLYLSDYCGNKLELQVVA